MQAQYLQYGSHAVQLAMRPIQLWEVVFPKQHLPMLLKTVKWSGEMKPEIKMHMDMLRRIIKAKKIPKFDMEKTKPRILYHQNVAIYPIGIKPDATWPKGHQFEGLEQL